MEKLRVRNYKFERFSKGKGKIEKVEREKKRLKIEREKVGDRAKESDKLCFKPFSHDCLT